MYSFVAVGKKVVFAVGNREGATVLLQIGLFDGLFDGFIDEGTMVGS